jgi:hypothetical protein
VLGTDADNISWPPRPSAQLELRLNSAPLLLLSSNVEEDNAVLTVDLANPGMVSHGLGGELVHV